MGEQEPWVGVGKSALGVAMVRAGESSRADRLFDDPDAQAFLDAAPGSSIQSSVSRLQARTGWLLRPSRSAATR